MSFTFNMDSNGFQEKKNGRLLRAVPIWSVMKELLSLNFPTKDLFQVNLGSRELHIPSNVAGANFVRARLCGSGIRSTPICGNRVPKQ